MSRMLALTGLDDPGRDDNEIFFEKLRAIIVTHDTSVTEQVRALNQGRVAPDHWDPHNDVVSVDISYDNQKESVATALGNAALHNALFHRTVLVLSSMKVEMRALIDELHTTLLPPLALYGDADPIDGDMKTEDGVTGLGSLIPHLMDIWNWHDRVKAVVKLTVQQFAALYDESHSQTKFAPYQTVQFASLWYTFFDLIGSVAVIEEVISQHEMLQASVNRYMRIMEQVKRHPDKYDNANPQYVEEFGRLVVKLDNDLMQRKMLMSLALLKVDSRILKPTANVAFYRIFIRQFESFITRDNMARRDGRHQFRVISACATWVVMSHLFAGRLAGSDDMKRITAAVYGIHTVVPVVPIIGYVSFRTALWLTRRLPSQVTSVTKDPQKDNISSVQEEARRLGATFEADIRRMKLEVAVWQAQMQSSYSHDRDKIKLMLGTVTDQILRGISIAYRVKHIVSSTIAAYEAAQMKLSLSAVAAMHVGIDLLIAIRHTYHVKTRFIAAMFPIILDHHSFSMSFVLYDIYKRLTKELQQGGGGIRPAVAEAMTDQQCAIGQALALLSRPLSRQGVTCLEIVMHVAFHRESATMSQVLGPRTVEELFNSFSILRNITDHQRALREATDCDFLYWQREALLPLFVSSVFKQPTSALRLRTLTVALHDSIPLMLTAKHVKKPQEVVDKFEKFVLQTLETCILRPLYRAIDEDIRNHALAAVTNEHYKGVRAHSKIELLNRLTQLPRMRLFGKWFCIKERVEDHLDRTFYDLNAMTPADSLVYAEMRNQAALRYKLTLLDSGLPENITEQGLDVLIITKNIHKFVVNFSYNLNEQLFVERPTARDDKLLNTLHIRHVANCIRTHGTGIMNTTVNHVYKCLLKKLSVVSQFLYDDHIRSKLHKDIKFFAEQKHALNGRFPVKRAEKLSSEVRKLGVTEDNRSYLDAFRETISEIGNALGYMRLVRSGGLRCIAEAASYVPHLDTVPFFEKVCNPNAVRDGEEPPEEELDYAPQVTANSYEAIRVLDSALENLTKRLSDGSDYLLMLLRAIRQKLADPKKYAHLRHFFMIVPSLCLSYVEMMIHQKERLMKKNKEGLFTDDGFALGCVFLLALFSKNITDFDSLHWFESVVHHYQEKRTQTKADLTERIEQSRKDGDTMASQTIQLTLSMVEASLAEYSALQQSFNCCRVFFQAKKREVSEEAEDDEEEEASPTS
jgi:WASH complex subunit 7